MAEQDVLKNAILYTINTAEEVVGQARAAGDPERLKMIFRQLVFVEQSGGDNEIKSAATQARQKVQSSIEEGTGMTIQQLLLDYLKNPPLSRQPF